MIIFRQRHQAPDNAIYHCVRVEDAEDFFRLHKLCADIKYYYYTSF